MKKFLFAPFLAVFCAGWVFAARNFIEGTDYFADFKNNDEGRAAVLHINFTDLMPAPEEAQAIIKDQLKIYAKVIEAEARAEKKEKQETEKNAGKDKKKIKSKIKHKKMEDIKDPEELKAFFQQEDAKEEKFKNIIGSVWYGSEDDPENRQKIQYAENSSAFVFIGKTKKIVPFPDYIKFLKKEKDDRKQKEKERMNLIKQLIKQQRQEMTQELQEPQF